MEISERESSMLAEVFTEVQARFVDFTDLAHGWEHVYRAYHLSLRIAEQEHANRFIVGMAALLHDVGRTTQEPKRPHAERSALLAAELLARYDLSDETEQAILHAILVHNYRRGITPATLEARVLYDADRLDSMGAIGLMRWAMTLKNKKWSEWKSYDPDDPFAVQRAPDDQHYLLDRFFTKLLALPEAMTTETGRAIAQSRLAFFYLFLQELQLELVDGGYSGAELGDKIFHIVYQEQHTLLPTHLRDATFVQRMTYLLWIAHKLAEMATYVADICQRVIFIVEGQMNIQPGP